jgi:predicted ester cyclase
MEVIAMSDLETNKAIALRLVEVFNGRQLDRLEDVLHPKFRGRGISAVVPGGPEVGPGARRKLYQMFLQAIPDARGQVVDVVAEGDKVVLVDRFGVTHRGGFSAVPVRAITSSGRPSISTPFVTAKSSKTPS